MPSLTTWARLEPRDVGEDIATGYAARVHDPLWLLTRQWQLGEFQGQDGGTPVVARWRARSSPLTRFEAGPIPWNTVLTAPTFDANAVPLQTLVERQPTQRASSVAGLDGLRLAVEAGQHFLRLVKLTVSTDYRATFVALYAVPSLTDDQRAGADADTVAYAGLVSGRALDGRRLRAGLGDPAAPRLDAALQISTADKPKVLAAAVTWLAWYDALFSEPDPAARSWQPDRMEYAFTLSTRLGDDQFGERPLSAEQYADGALDWYSFDLNLNINTGTAGDPPGSLIARTVVPAPLTFHGMPAQRFWELEDARIDLGALQPGVTDLAQMLLVETMTGYGNDWYVIPIELAAGSLVASTSLVVTDTFGVQTLLRPAGDPHLTPSHSGSSMFTLSVPVDPGAVGGPSSNLFFLPATVVAQDGPVLEEVMMLRDELANLAWAVERRLENPLEAGIETARDIVDLTGAPVQPEPEPVYQLATPTPPHWVPLLPVRPDPASAEVRLARGAALALDGIPHLIPAQARLLQPNDSSGRLLIREEEVPREGVVVRRLYRAARWYDGSLVVWAGNQAAVGRGEGSSGLAFDTLDAV